MNTDHTHHVCPVCGGTDTRGLIHLPRIPVHCNVLWATRDEALRAPRGDMDLGYCRTCGHMWNTRFDASLMEYSQAYENSLHFSPRFREYAESLADRLVREYAIRNTTVIDIGCGKGDFLAMLCTMGENRGFGFDPSYQPGLQGAEAESRMTIIRDFYGPAYASHHADLICCRHVLEHISSPRAFLENVRQAAGEREKTVIFFEVPNGLWTLRDLGVWDLIYEHYSYFSPSSLTSLFSTAGFTVLGTEELYGGQFLGIDARVRAATERESAREAPGGGVDRLAADFAERYRQTVDSWSQRFAQFRREGTTVVVWGGGSKGVTFLNTLGVREEVSAMVDINPRKHGHYVAGTGHEIVGPEALARIRPDVVIVANPLYVEEVRGMMGDLHRSADLLPL